MRIDLLTLFPEMCETVLSESIIGRARANDLVDIRCHNIRDYTKDKHRRVDDYPYGGGAGMLMQPQPVYDCYMAVKEDGGDNCHVIFMSPQGKTLNQEKVKELAEMDHLILLCGHYEGIDERVLEKIVDEEISIGDYVLTGGELPACILTDSVCRMLPGVLSSDVSFSEESHYGHLLEYPQYTRPAVWKESEVPPVLLSGDHGKVDKWRLRKAVERTLERRPDMLENVKLSSEERKIISEIRQKKDS